MTTKFLKTWLAKTRQQKQQQKLQAYEATYLQPKKVQLTKPKPNGWKFGCSLPKQKIIISDDEGDGLMEIFLQPVLQTYESREEEYDNWYMLSVLK